MKFTALPVKKGDSFLLEISRKKILVDTGEDKNECRDFILKKKIDKLDLVIITHYDIDHVNGLINLLKSQIKITEIWLPENFGRINKTLKQKDNNILKRMFEDKNKSREYNKESIIHVISKDIRNNKIISEIANESNKFVLYQMIYLGKKYENCYEKWIGKKDDDIIRFTQPELDILIIFIKSNLIRKISEIVQECRMKANIRWLKYTGEYKNEKINKNINIYGLNCKENKNIKEYYNDLETILQLTTINRESLVFKYQYGKKPNILFSSDSGFEFVIENKTINLNDNSLVTAAHHGSGDELNVKTYNLVKGENLIYIRSDNVNQYRPCCEYIKLKKKYCTVCNSPPNIKKKEIILKYKLRRWDTKNKECTCRRDC